MRSLCILGLFLAGVGCARPAADSASARLIPIEVKNDGYVPSEVSAAPGERVTLVFTRTGSSKCGEKVVFPDLSIERTLPLDEAVPVEVTVPDSGRLGFACGMKMLEGAVVVRPTT